MTLSKGRRNPNLTSYRGVTAQRMSAGLDKVRQANAGRIPCAQCGLSIAPDGMARHIALVHDEEE